MIYKSHAKYTCSPGRDQKAHPGASTQTADHIVGRQLLYGKVSVKSSKTDRYMTVREPVLKDKKCASYLKKTISNEEDQKCNIVLCPSQLERDVHAGDES